MKTILIQLKKFTNIFEEKFYPLAFFIVKTVFVIFAFTLLGCLCTGSDLINIYQVIIDLPKVLGIKNTIIFLCVFFYSVYLNEKIITKKKKN